MSLNPQKSNSGFLGDDRTDDLASHIGEPEIAPVVEEGQSLMI
jgi:hypothetical protein